jgi:transcriptional regulator with XRE-family HTH domain
MNDRTELKKKVAKRLKELRHALSFTQETMSRIIETGRPNYTRIEIGDIFINHYSLYKLAVEFNVSMDWLICGKGPMFLEKKNSRETEPNQFVQPNSQDISDLLEYMEKIPALNHEVIGFFHRLKDEHREVIDVLLDSKIADDS